MLRTPVILYADKSQMSLPTSKPCTQTPTYPLLGGWHFKSSTSTCPLSSRSHSVPPLRSSPSFSLRFAEIIPTLVLDLSPVTNHLLRKTSTSLTRSEPSVALSWCHVPHLYSAFFFFYSWDVIVSLSRLLASFVSTFAFFFLLIITLLALTQYSVYNNYLLNEQRIVTWFVLRCFSYYSSDTIECLPLWGIPLFLTNNFLGIKEGYLIKLSHQGQQTTLQKKQI